MARLLDKIADPQNDTKKINNNFDRIALDLADLTGNQSTVASFSGTVGAATTLYQEISITDDRDIYQSGSLPFLPRFDAYIDNNLSATRIYPSGTEITQTELHNIQIEVTQAKSVLNQITNEKATISMIFRNRDTVAHTFYVYLDGFYLPSPQVGVAKRTT
jgi:hypothetical protein